MIDVQLYSNTFSVEVFCHLLDFASFSSSQPLKMATLLHLYCWPHVQPLILSPPPKSSSPSFPLLKTWRMSSSSSTTTTLTRPRTMCIVSGAQPAVPTRAQPTPSSPLATCGRHGTWCACWRRRARPSTPSCCSWWTLAVEEVEVRFKTQEQEDIRRDGSRLITTT